MKTKIAVAMFLLLAVSSFALETNSAIVSGYLSGEFAVKENIEKQLEGKVVTPLKAEVSNALKAKDNKVEITIHVTGYADQTGGGANNDHLAKSRAEEVAAFLTQKFPNAKITALSKGDSRNVRMTTVEWKVISTPLSKIASENWTKMVLMGGFLLLAGLVTIFMVKKPKIVTISVPSPVVLPVPWEPGQKEMKVVTNTRIYRVIVTLGDTEKGKMWIAPFLTQKHPQGNEMREDYGQLKKAVTRCIKNPQYEAEIKTLIAAGKIKIEEIQEKEKLV